MVPLLAVLAFQVPAPTLPVWAVTEFQDLKAGNRKIGQAAAEALRRSLKETKEIAIVPTARLEQAAAELKLNPTFLTVPDLGRLGLAATDERDPRRTIVAGEVVDYLVRNVKGARMGVAAVRAVAYDAASALPVSGALDKGEFRGTGAESDAKLIAGAVRQAAEVAARTLRANEAPVATILNAAPGAALLNKGVRAGLRAGDTVAILRGGRFIGKARISVVEPDQAEIVFERTGESPMPGDRVLSVFTPPPAVRPGVLETR